MRFSVLLSISAALFGSTLGGCLLFATPAQELGKPDAPNVNGGDAGVVVDSGGALDAGATLPDAGAVVPDAGVVVPDAGAVVPDAGAVVPDAGAAVPDAGAVDAGAVDAGAVDAGAVDAGAVDAGAVDAGICVCNDGNTIDDDYCSNDCQTSGSCGDGTVQSAVEECDPDFDQPSGDCTPECRLWWDLSLPIRIPVDIDNTTDQTLLNVPVLLRLPASLESEIARSEVCVVNRGHAVRLSAEFDSTMNAEVLIWVRVPVLPPDGQRIFLYGSPFAGATDCGEENDVTVFGSAYKGVWHMESTSPTDVTENGLDASPFGNPTMTPNGIVGTAVATGDLSYLRVEDAGLQLGFTKDLTVEVWVRINTLNPGSRSTIFHLSPASSQSPETFLMNMRHDGNMLISWQPNGPNPNASGSFDLVQGVWHHYAWTRDSSDMMVHFYLDGSELGQPVSYNTEPVVDAEAIFRMGGTFADNWALGGAIDEARITDRLLSAQWIQFQFDTMQRQLATLGAPEAQ